MSIENKYLKYKNKYITLKNNLIIQKAGNDWNQYIQYVSALGILASASYYGYQKWKEQQREKEEIKKQQEEKWRNDNLTRLSLYDNKTNTYVDHTIVPKTITIGDYIFSLISYDQSSQQKRVVVNIN